jgi:uncharacterized linocin/CFP29 family protein
MSECGPALTDDQWNRIRQIVHDEAMRARVAASFLPLYGPLPGDATTVPADSLTIGGTAPNLRLDVDDFTAIRLATVSVNVLVRNHMLADPELVAASIMFRRAANIVARVEDAIIFRGRDVANNPPIPRTNTLPQVFVVAGADTYPGLIDLAPDDSPLPTGPLGPAVFAAIVQAINLLETAAYFKPYACVLSNDLFAAVYTPIPGSMVLPADSIPPILNGPLLRSSTLNPGTGLVVSLQGNPVEIVMGSEIHVRYLQGTPDGEHSFRVAQRFLLRVKDPTAIVSIGLTAPVAAPAAGAPPGAAPPAPAPGAPPAGGQHPARDEPRH